MICSAGVFTDICNGIKLLPTCYIFMPFHCPAVIGMGTFGDEVDADLLRRPGPGVHRGCDGGDQSFGGGQCGFMARRARSAAASRASYEFRYSSLKCFIFLRFPARRAARCDTASLGRVSLPPRGRGALQSIAKNLLLPLQAGPRAYTRPELSLALLQHLFEATDWDTKL